MKIDIAAMPIGGKPPGFTEGLTGQGDPVRWQVLADDSAPGGRVIAETSGDTADYRFPICVYDDVTAKDVAVSVRFKPVAGEVDQAAGLIVRAQDDMNFYVARANGSRPPQNNPPSRVDEHGRVRQKRVKPGPEAKPAMPTAQTSDRPRTMADPSARLRSQSLFGLVDT